jgi:hypothetical protein
MFPELLKFATSRGDSIRKGTLSRVRRTHAVVEDEAEESKADTCAFIDDTTLELLGL